ncbi:hypothetical protein LX32DRAFT_682448 [Colletotrichum zoysiae]|uniref:Uncharacterized protein n=1 Tax=Colletotrichum zoysiae TaxID=1216348 RepID=A0AAD9HIJ4_9PEZI|nr:hypothetical protein LX32DRAFT_682448 [Colletotrichum zoysiae]
MAGFRHDMRVKEKLSLGVSQSFRKRTEFNTQAGDATDRLLSSGQEEISHLEFTPCHGRGLEGSTSALQHKDVVQDGKRQDRTYKFSVMESMLRKTANEPSHHYAEESKRLTEHVSARSRFVKSAHKRLEVVIRLRSKKPHTIPGLLARRRPGQIMNVEWQQEYHGLAMSMSFSAFQSQSMEANGYQKRGIRYLHFRKVDMYRTFPGPPLVTATVEDCGASSSTDMFFQDGIDGNLSMTELDITDVNGGKRRWICIEISRPLVQAIGPVPSELMPVPCSYLRISAPYDKVLIMTDPREFDEGLDRTRSPQLGDFKGLTAQGHGRGKDVNRARLRMCSDGVPIFATGSKKGIPFANRIEDFLFAKNVTGLPWKETDRRVSNATKAMRKQEFWERCRSAAEVDKARWKSLQDAMARGDCIVDITFKGEWDKVEPSVEVPQVVRMPSVIPQTGLHPFLAQRAGGSGSRRVGNSGLRNEVQF